MIPRLVQCVLIALPIIGAIGGGRPDAIFTAGFGGICIAYFVTGTWHLIEGRIMAWRAARRCVTCLPDFGAF